MVKSRQSVARHRFVPLALSLEKELDDFSYSAAAAGMRGDDVRELLCFVCGVRYRDSESGSTQQRDVYNVVADVADLCVRQFFLRQHLFVRLDLVPRHLVEVRYAEFLRARAND